MNYEERLRKMSDDDLIHAFNVEVGGSGCPRARLQYLRAIHEEFNVRDLDYTDIGDRSTLSFKHKIKRDGKKIRIDHHIPKSNTNSRP